MAPLLVSAAIYSCGFFVLWRRSRRGRRRQLRSAGFYATGWLSLAAALISPLHELGEHLFTAHMIEHELVMTVAAPLLVLARPGPIFLWSFQPATRRLLGQWARRGPLHRTWDLLTRPLTATALHGIAIWVWHIPIFFDAAANNVDLHRLQHLSFFLTAVWFWWSLVWRSDSAVAAGELFVTMIHTGILGALMALVPRVLYATQSTAAALWGLTPLEDQQLAGLVMWIPVGTVYAGAAIISLARWVTRSSTVWKLDDVPTA
jgi:cytochrome c oxidase assembly factor CtaG